MRRPIVIRFSSWWANGNLEDSTCIASVLPFSPSLAFEYKCFRRVLWPINRSTDVMFRMISDCVHQGLHYPQVVPFRAPGPLDERLDLWRPVTYALPPEQAWRVRIVVDPAPTQRSE